MLQIRRHLDECPGCLAEHAALVRVKTFLSGAPPVEPAGDAVAAVMQRWSERRGQPVPAAPHWNWKWTWRNPLPRRQRFGLVLTSVSLVLVLAGTAVALRKPNYPDAVVANFGPLLSRQDETLPQRIPPHDLLDWIQHERRGRWQMPSGEMGAMLVSDRSFSVWGR